jgi:hypothetical protein
MRKLVFKFLGYLVKKKVNGKFLLRIVRKAASEFLLWLALSLIGRYLCLHVVVGFWIDFRIIGGFRNRGDTRTSFTISK